MPEIYKSRKLFIKLTPGLRSQFHCLNRKDLFNRKGFLIRSLWLNLNWSKIVNWNVRAINWHYFLNNEPQTWPRTWMISRCQFHQHFMRNFFVRKCFAQLFCSHSLAFKKFGAKILAQNLQVKCWWNLLKVSISSTFYAQLFCTKVLCAAFLHLRFGFVIFCQKNISAKAARKMLMKLVTGIFDF